MVELDKKKNILFVSHDGNRAGAQIFLFNIAQYFKKSNYKVAFLFINDWGSMQKEFDKNFKTYYLNRKKSAIKSLFNSKTVLENISIDLNPDVIYANTIASLDQLEKLKTHFKKPIISHLHELSYSIGQYGPLNYGTLLENYTDKIIGCSLAVTQNIIDKQPHLKNKIVTVHSFVDNEKILKKVDGKKNRKTLPKDKFIVGACGNSDWRKAPDIFIQIAKNAIDKCDNILFVWIGMNLEDKHYLRLIYDCERMGISEHVHFIAPTTDAISIINEFDVFLNCSREDPFPLVMLEAALCEKALVGFKNTGGAAEFIEKDCGYLAEYLDTNQMAQNIKLLHDNTDQVITFGKAAKHKVLNQYSFEYSIQKLRRIIDDL